MMGTLSAVSSVPTEWCSSMVSAVTRLFVRRPTFAALSQTPISSASSFARPSTPPLTRTCPFPERVALPESSTRSPFCPVRFGAWMVETCLIS